jgi:mono/diheme cytochrome c family protein
MRGRRWLLGLSLLGLTWTATAASGPERNKSREAAERGYAALTTRAFNTAIWTASAYENVWKRWGLTARPADFDQRVRDRYGLHEPPYPNNGLPMGLREGPGLLGAKGVTNDCLLCHGGSIAGRSVIGLGNASLDIEAIFDDMSAVRTGETRRTLFPFSNVRGTSEAGAMAVFLFSIRNPDLSLRASPLDLGLRADLCEDAPAWWLLKKKKTMYWTGSTDARSVRSLMQFALSPLKTLKGLQEMEPMFADLQAYLLSLEPPKYPLPIDRPQAARGEHLFKRDCARCHGTYGSNGTYPNKVIDLDEIGTDPNRALGIGEKAKAHYDQTWFADERGPDGRRYETRVNHGYQAPPLDGVWATAPYFHNGAAPTVWHVLSSEARPTVFTRSYRTGLDDYDAVKLGWKITVLDGPPAKDLPPVERRKIYDTTQPGRRNTGHTFGDHLTDAERMAVIEYLKTL